MWSPDVSFGLWAWNVTMQNASEATQRLMQRHLEVAVRDNNNNPLDAAERAQLLKALLRFRPEHGIERAEWNALRDLHRQEVIDWLESDAFFAENTRNWPIIHGLLGRPVGGVFNVSNVAARQEAYEWAQQRYSAWSPARANHMLNYAIFDVGPGSLDDRVAASALLEVLDTFGEESTLGQLEFTDIEAPEFRYFLIQVTGAGIALDGTEPRRRATPLSNIRFAFIQPQNARDRALQQEQIQTIADLDLVCNRAAPGRQDFAGAGRGAAGRFHDMIPANHAWDDDEDMRVLDMEQIDGLAVHGPRPNHERRLRNPEPAAARVVQDVENETIVGWDFVPAAADELVPRRERRFEAWAQPWDELTRTMQPASQGSSSTSEDSEADEMDDGAGL